MSASDILQVLADPRSVQELPETIKTTIVSGEHVMSCHGGVLKIDFLRLGVWRPQREKQRGRNGRNDAQLARAKLGINHPGHVHLLL